jgi:pimeloyl-ACP methyl ester carboxylesterase
MRLSAFLSGLGLVVLSVAACGDDGTPSQVQSYPTTSGADAGHAGTSDGGGQQASDAGEPAPADAGTFVDAGPPVPSGCVTDVTAGDHVFTCGGLKVDARIPAACTAPGCGLILELHGDTGSGLLMDGHVKLRDQGDKNGYVVIAPSGPPYGGGQPGSTWSSADDPKLVAMVQTFASVFRVNMKKIHVAGFSRGGFVTWRLLCDHPDLFASASPGGAGNGANFGETTCFEQGHTPARKIPFLLLMGQTDASVGYQSMTTIRDAAVKAYGAGSPKILAQDANYTHNRWAAPGGEIIETLDHKYETLSSGPFGSAKGHCIPGSTSDPNAPQYAIPCKLPNAFIWGDEIMKFFMAHPM